MTIARPPMITNPTLSPARASTMRRKSVTTASLRFLEELQHLPHSLDALGRSQAEVLVDQRGIDTRRDLLEDPLIPGLRLVGRYDLDRGDLTVARQLWTLHDD